MKHKYFTDKEFKTLTLKEIHDMIDNNVSFSVNTFIYLNDEFVYCNESKQILNNNKTIALTKLESRLLDLLMSNKSVYVSYDLIKELVWNGKNMSVFTMRNTVKKIRDKTFENIIINKSNHGYKICDF